MPTCHGNGPNHCCWVAGKPCPFLEYGTVEGRRFVCGLYREHGSWELVHQDSKYLTQVRPVWDRLAVARGNYFPDCGDWPIGERDQCCFKPGWVPVPDDAVDQEVLQWR